MIVSRLEECLHTMFTQSLGNLKSFVTNVLSGTIVVSVGLFIASFLSYLLQIFLGRYLTVEEFGVFTSLLSVFYIVGFSNNVFLTSLIKLVSDMNNEAERHLLRALFSSFSKIFLGIGVLLFTLLIVGMSSLANYLRIDTGQALFAFSLYVALSLLGTVPQAYLQGLQRYKGFAIFLVTGNSLRLIIPIYFAYLGFGVSGVFFGIIASTLINYSFGYFLLRKNFQYDSLKIELGGYVKKVFVFSAPVFVVNACLMLLNNIDIILVKHFFTPVDAGLYSGVVTIGKVLLFGAGAVGVVMFPQIASLHAKGVDYTARFKQFLLLQVFLLICGTTLFYFFPDLIVSVMFGDKFIAASTFLPNFAIFVSLYVLINFFILYFLAINKTKVFLIMLPMILLQWILIHGFHRNLTQVINVNILSSTLMLAGLLLYYKVHVRYSNNTGI